MSTAIFDDLVLTLANTLSSIQIDSKAIEKSLNIICHHLSFDCGFIYEIDQFNQFTLQEHYQTTDTLIRETFHTDEISSSSYQSLIEQTIIHICHSDSVDVFEQEICKIFKASVLIVYPIKDNSKHILGLIILTKLDIHLSIEDTTSLQTALSILAKYIMPRMYENKLSFTITSLESILDNTGIDIYVNDFNTHDILYVNKSMAVPYGGMENFMGKKCWEVLFVGQTGPCEFCPQKNIIDEDGNPTKVYTWDYQRSFDGSWFRVFSAAFRWSDGRLAHVVSSADITDNKNYEALIYRMANYDSLTNLPNRRRFLEECEKIVNNTEENNKAFILFFDIDNFKDINDTYGHDAGDEFLIALGEFFSNIPMLKDSIYRNGGDEFIAIIGGEHITKNNIQNLAHFIHKRFEKPWKLKKGDIYCNTSIGVSCYPDDGLTGEELIHKADLAMYKVKKLGGANICFELD